MKSKSAASGLLLARLSEAGLVVGNDGEHWFTTSSLGHVTRHVIKNFDHRPWAP